MIVPSGHRRQMESQEYIYNAHDDAADDILERMLRKAAALGIGQDDAVEEFAGQPQPQLAPVPEEGQNEDINKAVDTGTLSNNLPQDNEKIMVVNKDGQPRNDQQGKVVAQILELLRQSNWAGPGTYVITDFDTSEGIRLNAVQKAPTAGPVVEKP